MSTRVRGLIVFLVIILVAVVFCAYIPFVAMPAAGIGIALPVITVPGEVVVEGGFFGVDLTNTIIGTILADLMVLLFVALGWFASKGWTKEVPNKAQALVEAVVGGIYNFLKGLGGARFRTAPMLWPIAGTIFIFLLAGNWMKLFPGVETVGKMHCAYVGFNGYPIVQGATATSWLLYVDAPLNAGEPQTEAEEHVCEEYFKYKEFTRFEGETSLEALNTAVADAEVVASNAAESLAALQAAPQETEEYAAQLLEAEETFGLAERNLERARIRLESFEQVETLEPQLERLRENLAALQAEPAAEEGDHSEGETAAAEGEGEVAATTPVVTAEQLEAEITNLEAQLNTAQTQLQYPGATVALTTDQLNKGVLPYKFHITPFVRGPATDLSLTFALAIMAMVLVQAYGVWAQGPAYFEKFINISALGNLGKKPLGAIDFIVGLIEIISEIGKIVSLAFRLFGNLFAGGVALMAISFLVSMLVPGIIFGLEVIIGSVQALVFAVLFVVFAVQAMESHHGGDEHDHEHAEH